MYLMFLMFFGLVVGPGILEVALYSAYYGDGEETFCLGVCCVAGLFLSPLLLGLAPKSAKVQVDETR